MDGSNSVPEFLWLLVQLVAWGLLLIVIAYCVVRAASFAWFRTKLEHFRHMINERERHRGDD